MSFRFGLINYAASRAFAAFTRPADAIPYSVGDLVANSVTAAAVVPVPLNAARAQGGTGRLKGCKLSKTNNSLANAQFRVHIYKTAPTCTNGDNGAWLTSASVYLGFADVTMDKQFTDEAVGFGMFQAGTFAKDVFFDTNSGSNQVFALVEARAAYTPAASEVFTISIEVDQD